MNLVKELTELYNGSYSESKPRMIHIAHGMIHEQKVQGTFNLSGIDICVIGDFQMGTSFKWVEDPKFCILLKTTQPKRSLRIYPRSLIFRVMHKLFFTSGLRKYKIEGDVSTNFFLNSTKFTSSLCQNNVYISTTNQGNKFYYQLYAKEEITEVSSLKKLYELMVYLGEVLNEYGIK